MIPEVKVWLVTTVKGAQWEVMAPTRRLAVLNFRGCGHWDPIAKVGLARKPQCSSGPVYVMVSRRS